MAKEYSGSPKLSQLEAKRKRLTWILGVSGLCIFFYVLGAWQNTSAPTSQAEAYDRVGCDNNTSQGNQINNNNAVVVPSSSSIALDFESHHSVEINYTDTVKQFPPCSMQFSEYTPCEDRNRGRKFDRNRLKYRERHCPDKKELLFCLIPAPPKYKTPFKWPQSRDYAWYDNIPHRELSVEKAVQNWIQVEGERFRFPGGGTGFPLGADAYIDDISHLIPLTDGTIRTAIDTGCGVSSSPPF